MRLMVTWYDGNDTYVNDMIVADPVDRSNIEQKVTDILRPICSDPMLTSIVQVGEHAAYDHETYDHFKELSPQVMFLL